METLSNFLKTAVVASGLKMAHIAKDNGRSRASMTQFLKNNSPPIVVVLEILDAVGGKLLFRLDGEEVVMTKENTVAKDVAEYQDFSTQLQYLLMKRGYRKKQIAELRNTTNGCVYYQFQHNRLSPSLLIDIAEVTGGEFGILDKEGGFFNITRETSGYRRGFR